MSPCWDNLCLKQLDPIVKLGHHTGIAVPVRVGRYPDAAGSPVKGRIPRRIIYLEFTCYMSKSWWKILQRKELKDLASSNCKPLQLPSGDTFAGTTAEGQYIWLWSEIFAGLPSVSSLCFQALGSQSCPRNQCSDWHKDQAVDRSERKYSCWIKVFARKIMDKSIQEKKYQDTWFSWTAMLLAVFGAKSIPNSSGIGRKLHIIKKSKEK